MGHACESRAFGNQMGNNLLERLEEALRRQDIRDAKMKAQDAEMIMMKASMDELKSRLNELQSRLNMVAASNDGHENTKSLHR